MDFIVAKILFDMIILVEQICCPGRYFKLEHTMCMGSAALSAKKY